jgi:hypothetical protein
VVRRVGAIPTEYVYYFYDGRRYLDEVARAGSSRGQDVQQLNVELLAGLAKAFDDGVGAAWSAYETLLGVRRDTYMQTDTRGDSGQGEARARRAAQRGPGLAAAPLGGYEGLALQVIDGLSGHGERELIVNVVNSVGLGGTTRSAYPGGTTPQDPPAPHPLGPTSGRPSRLAPASRPACGGTGRPQTPRSHPPRKFRPP